MPVNDFSTTTPLISSTQVNGNQLPEATQGQLVYDVLQSPICPCCPKQAISRRDMKRHVWYQHGDYALSVGIPPQDVVCPAPGCNKTGRSDNISRHYKTKHGGGIR
jgi:hypothetical protein